MFGRSMAPDPTPPQPPAPSVSVPLLPREELVRVRAGAWRLLLPLRFVERVLGAALPAARPSAGGAEPPVVAIGGALVPVLFAEALLGADEVAIDAEDQMILLAAGGRRALLWVDAVEEVVDAAPVDPPAGAAAHAPPSGDAVVAGFSGAGQPLAVLDVPRLLELAA